MILVNVLVNVFLVKLRLEKMFNDVLDKKEVLLVYKNVQQFL